MRGRLSWSWALFTALAAPLGCAALTGLEDYELGEPSAVAGHGATGGGDASGTDDVATEGASDAGADAIDSGGEPIGDENDASADVPFDRGESSAAGDGGFDAADGNLDVLADAPALDATDASDAPLEAAPDGDAAADGSSCVAPSVDAGKCLPGLGECTPGAGCVTSLLSSTTNCGACGHDCLGGTCTSGQCDPAFAQSVQGNVSVVTTDAASVYWSDITTGDVFRAPLGGGTAQSIATAQGLVYEMAVDDNAAYWLAYDGGWFLRAVALAGGPSTTFATVQAYPQGLTFDASYLYWTDPGDGGRLKRISKTGGSAIAIVAGQNDLEGLAVDDTYVYFTTGSGSGGTLSRAPITGQDATAELLYPNQNDPNGVAIDATSVYWTAQGSGHVRSASKTGGPAITLASGQHAPTDIAVDATHVYWLNEDQAIMRVPKCGGTPVEVAWSSGGRFALSHDALFFDNRGGSETIQLVAK